ncbi:hypothetical protein C4D60_Mb10t22150 [Musa balbisiana]|uniref:IBH1-like N-terminal domain-containing protein n=1 Tax=Musa balbisiana TaxID=52838 RepID=A0A4S8IZ18_MUSBA|nr:hypothetical protein C4D60_Mb10t22150 [Musa balbisiana]
MQVTEAFKHAFLKQMLLGFQAAAVSTNTMGFQDRKNAIKLSADVAMAVARGSRKWTRGLIAGLSEQQQNRSFLQLILGEQHERLMKPWYSSWKIPRCKKIVRRSLRVCCSRQKKKKKNQSGVLARTLVEKRTQELKRLVPGGESMDGFSLFDETLDYVLSLRAQVDLMQSLLTTFEASKLRSHSKRTLPERKASYLSADVAMAVARGSRKWTRGLIAGLSEQQQNRSFLQLILGEQHERLMKPWYSSWKIPRCKKIVRRSLRVCCSRQKKKKKKKNQSGVLARTLVEKRTQELKRLVPGGESMDGFSLFDETLDYVLSLRAQVDLMQSLLTTFEASKLRSHSKRTLPERKASYVGK